MTEPYYPNPVPVPNRAPTPGPEEPRRPWSAARVDVLAQTYSDLRQNCIDLEEIIASSQTGDSELSEEDLKRLDKAVTVMKVSFKLVKKVLGRHGRRGLKPKSKDQLDALLAALQA